MFHQVCKLLWQVYHANTGLPLNNNKQIVFSKPPSAASFDAATSEFARQVDCARAPLTTYRYARNGLLLAVWRKTILSEGRVGEPLGLETVWRVIWC